MTNNLNYGGRQRVFTLACVFKLDKSGKETNHKGELFYVSPFIDDAYSTIVGDAVQTIFENVVMPLRKEQTSQTQKENKALIKFNRGQHKKIVEQEATIAVKDHQLADKDARIAALEARLAAAGVAIDPELMQ
jgi:hypothetical protein